MPSTAASTGSAPCSRARSAASTALRHPSVTSSGPPTPPCAIAAAFQGTGGRTAEAAGAGAGLDRSHATIASARSMIRMRATYPKLMDDTPVLGCHHDRDERAAPRLAFVFQRI